MTFTQLIRVCLTGRDRLMILGLSLFAFVVSVIETVCLSAVMPFLFLATGSQQQFMPRWVGTISLRWFGSGLLVLCLLRAVGSALFTHWLHQYSQGLFKRIGSQIFANYLRAPYQDHVAWNSTAILKMITNDAFHVGLVVSCALQLLAELCVIAAMYGTLLWVHWKATVAGSAVFVLGMFLLMRPLLQAAHFYGDRKGFFWRQVNQIFQEGFGNFKMIRLFGAELFLIDRFDRASTGISQAYARYFTVQSYPRLVLETVMLVGLVAAVLVIVGLYGAAAGPVLVSLLSLYGIAFYRLIPAMNRLVSHYGQMNFSLAAIGEFKEVLLAARPPVADAGKPLPFTTSLVVCGVSFAYDPARPVLHEVSCTITKGQRVAFVGKSGAGKSTLIDIILGLHAPQQGAVTVDGVALSAHNTRTWQNKIGYIPQQIYLFDGAVADNVVFGRVYDQEKLVHALQQAHIYDFLLTKDGLQTMVGEGGAQLSGGQRQRIALARALYGDPELLILDEATSALDKETESLILNDLFSLQGKTVLVITHRTEILAQCDAVYELKDGAIYDRSVRVDYAETKTRNFDTPSA